MNTCATCAYFMPDDDIDGWGWCDLINHHPAIQGPTDERNDAGRPSDVVAYITDYGDGGRGSFRCRSTFGCVMHKEMI